MATTTVDRAALLRLLEDWAELAQPVEQDEMSYDPEGERDAAVAGTWEQAYIALAEALPDSLVDTSSSASRQHRVDTGRYLTSED